MRISTEKFRQRVEGIRRRLGPPFADINDYDEKVYSQNGEDGILRRIFSTIGTHGKYAVEFGVGDGQECNSAHLVRDCGWFGLMMDGDPECYRRLKSSYAAFPDVKVYNRFITAENIGHVFEENSVPARFDLLSIDIDGNDYWVWRALTGYRPRVVTIEYNAAHPPPELWVMEYNPDHRWDLTWYFGASLTSLWLLGRSLGYALIGTDRHGVNAFFIAREELSGRLPGLGFSEVTPEHAYHAPGFFNQWGTLGHPPGTGPFRRI
ncbi:MAG TPA: hypothetical protein VGQ96_01285 [Candidatus Eremiobacteraceae bacterium]|nr:hypothetical protein [Candidatus Eremiobacteraceae bacterium]